MELPKELPASWARNRLIRDAMYAALLERMRSDPSVYLMGEGAEVKAHFDCPEMEKEFPGRVITLPISEDANTNFAVGLSLGGITPVVDVISSDFLFRTMDAVCNTAAKQAGTTTARTIVVKAEFLTGGPTTGQRVEAMFTGVPGLDVVLPSNPLDAYRLMGEALERKGVTLVFEDRMVEDKTTPADLQFGRPNCKECVGARVRLLGHRVTVVSYGVMARRLEKFLEGSEFELVDLRSLYPLDVATVCQSVVKTKRLLVVEPDCVHGGVGAEVVASVAERVSGFRAKRLGAPRKVCPVSSELQQGMLPTNDAVMRALEALDQ